MLETNFPYVAARTKNFRYRIFVASGVCTCSFQSQPAKNAGICTISTCENLSHTHTHTHSKCCSISVPCSVLFTYSTMDLTRKNANSPAQADVLLAPCERNALLHLLVPVDFVVFACGQCWFFVDALKVYKVKHQKMVTVVGSIK